MNRFNAESFERMKAMRHLPFLKRNMKVIVDGKPGKVTGNFGMNLLVKFDGEKRGGRNCHPHWETEYFDKNGVLLESHVKVKQTGNA